VGKLIGAALALAFLIWCASVAFKGMGPGADVVVDALLGDSADVTDLDGFVRAGDGYDVQIRFRAEEDWVLSIPHQGFAETECGRVKQTIRYSLLRTAAWPPWTPEKLEGVVCFSRSGENQWSPNGRDMILAEEEGGWVYFAGKGREHTKNLPGWDDKNRLPED
jgi:hypothetical protein